MNELQTKLLEGTKELPEYLLDDLLNFTRYLLLLNLGIKAEKLLSRNAREFIIIREKVSGSIFAKSL